jgi:hypothetical protein
LGTPEHGHHINSILRLQNDTLARTWSGQQMNQFPAGVTESCFAQNILTRSGAQPASYSMAARGSYLAVKWPGQAAGHSPPSSAEVKNEWSPTSTPHKQSECTPVQRYSLNELLNIQT